MLTKSIAAAGLLLIATLWACSSPRQTSASEKSDSSFAALQDRGGMAMGVDQYTSSHVFDITPDGGRVSLQRDSADSLGIAQIRAHMRLIQHSFAAGDFSAPAFVHQRDMPGTAVMGRKRDAISYTYEDLPSGGVVVMSTQDAEARTAIAEFMRAQRGDHHSGGSDQRRH